jgi:malonyl-CoA O-methyltransferase
MSSLAKKTIFGSFDLAAEGYDRAASVQAQIALRLVQKALKRLPEPPQSILDIGCGTGFVSITAARYWPFASITAMDAAPAMLDEARRKMPTLRTIRADIADPKLEPRFDIVLSSMAMHWLREPGRALTRWQNGLMPDGQLFAALLVDGSFQEWRDHCAAYGVRDGLWEFPPADFANGLASRSELEEITVEYKSATDFLRQLKHIGAATARPGHRPLDVPVMRKILAEAEMPFSVTYRVLYIEAPSI